MTLDASLIQGTLWQGSKPPPGSALRLRGFDVLVLCAAELQYPSSHFPGIEVLHVPLEDDSSRPVSIDDWQAIVAQGQRVARRLRAGKWVLVTCAKGLNRSGIVSATALHFLTGHSGSHCALAVQRKRAYGTTQALYNTAFVAALKHRLPAKRSISPTA